MVAGCDGPVEDERRNAGAAAESASEPSRVPRMGAMTAEDLRNELLEHLWKDEGLAPIPVEDRLRKLSVEEHLALLDWLASDDLEVAGEAEEGRRIGLATVILSVMGEKDPPRVAHYLAGEETLFGLETSAAGLLVFREVMTRWAGEDAEEALAALDEEFTSPELVQRMGQLAEMYGERLEVTLVGEMGLADLEALAAQWDRLQRREVASLLPRHLERAASEEAREALLDRSAEWLEEQWRRDGPGVIPEWALGLLDETLQQDVISRVNEPREDENRP